MKPLAIGTLSKESGVKVPTIRFYEQIGLLPAPPGPRAIGALTGMRTFGGSGSSVTPVSLGSRLRTSAPCLL